MRHRAPVRRLATVALLAAVMAACGGNDPNASTSTSTGGSTGNTTAATIPLATRDAVAGGRLQKGDLVLFAAVGAGYTAGANLWRWQC